MNIYGKLLQIEGDMTAVEKSGHNQFDKYDYIREDEILSQLRNLFQKHGVKFCIEMIEKPNVAEVYKTKSGKPRFLALCAFRYSFVNVDDPEDRVTSEFWAAGINDGDKAIGSALTYGKKYFLMKFFNVASSEDDPDGRADEVINKTKPEKVSNSKAPSMLMTTKQLIAYDELKKMVDQKIITSTEVQQTIKAQYGKSTIAELTDNQAIDVLERCQGLAEMRKGGE